MPKGLANNGFRTVINGYTTNGILRVLLARSNDYLMQLIFSCSSFDLEKHQYPFLKQFYQIVDNIIKQFFEHVGTLPHFNLEA